MKVLPCGDRALLLDCESLAEAHAWHGALRHLDPVIGARSVLVRGDVRQLRDAVSHTTPPADAAPDSAAAGNSSAGGIAIPVVYDGQDLDEVGLLTGLGADGVVAWHTGTTWTASFSGFAPGFAYLTGGGPEVVVPRCETPRSSVPAGSVGLAGGFSGVYPRSSPGGWQLIGRTDVVLFDVNRTPPALLTPGTRVRFEVKT